MYILKATTNHGTKCDDYVDSIREADALAAQWMGWGYANVRLLNDIGDVVKRYVAN